MLGRTGQFFITKEMTLKQLDCHFTKQNNLARYFSADLLLIINMVVASVFVHPFVHIDQ